MNPDPHKGDTDRQLLSDLYKEHKLSWEKLLRKLGLPSGQGIIKTMTLGEAKLRVRRPLCEGTSGPVSTAPAPTSPAPTPPAPTPPAPPDLPVEDSASNSHCPEEECQIQRLAITVLELMRTASDDWISWRQAARHQTGSTDGAELLSAVAALPQARPYFATTQHRVRLTRDGLQYVNSLQPAKQSAPGDIADTVVRYARQLRPTILNVDGITVIARADNKFVHAIHVELSDEILPAETPVKLTFHNQNPIFGKLVGQEPDGDVLYVSCDTDISPISEPKSIVIDRAFLLTQLAVQLRLEDALPVRLAAILESCSQPIIADVDSREVADRLAGLATPWSRFLWGPPGAGKTYGLGRLVCRLLEVHPHESVLIVAPSNRAVDVAMKQLMQQLLDSPQANLIRNRKLLRFGYARDSELLACPELLGPLNLDILNLRVQKASRKVAEFERKRLPESEIAPARAELLAAQEDVKAAVRDHVASCSVVATTTTLAYIPGSPVSARQYDTVIVDETTMVSPALCACLGYKAKRRFLLAGDPCQLGPVFEDHGTVDDQTASWLRDDVFVMGGVSTGSFSPDAVKLNDSRLVRITSQRRCAVDIWDQIRCYYPGVVNRTESSRVHEISDLKPAPGKGVVLVDLTATQSCCQQIKRSWQNAESAQISMRVAKRVAAQCSNWSIAIIAPYRAQVKLLRQLIRDEQKSVRSPLKDVKIDAGTVHQFQGSESDVVIFDVVDGPGRRNPGLLLRGNSGMRLVNVAVSRARGKLFVVANAEWLRHSELVSQNSLLAGMLKNINSSVSPASFQVVPADAADTAEISS